MSATRFLDTNVIVYAHDTADPAKQAVAHCRRRGVRLLITSAADGLFRLYEEHWNIWVENPGDAYWCRQGPDSFTDTLEGMQKVAADRLRAAF